MEITIHTILTIPYIIYCIIILLFIKGWNNCKGTNIIDDKYLPQITCIIALRNESVNIDKLLLSLNKLLYPIEKVEFIFVDDHSTDNTLVLLQSKKNELQFESTIMQNTGTGKKDAIREAIERAKYDYIALTDADCEVNQNWLLTIGSSFKTDDSDMIVAPVYSKIESSFISYFQSIDFISLIGSTAGAIGIKKPIMCNGANLAYKKENYYQVKNMINSEYLSGDDIFLLHEFKKADSKITFLKSSGAIVSTVASNNIKQFIKQRVRWASKSKAYTDAFTLIIAWVVFITNLLFVIAFLTVPFYQQYSGTVLIAWGAKVIVDSIMIKKGMNFFKIKTNIFKYTLTTLLYPFYIIFTVFWAAFGSTSWKNRQI